MIDLRDVLVIILVATIFVVVVTAIRVGDQVDLHEAFSVYDRQTEERYTCLITRDAQGFELACLGVDTERTAGR